MKKEINGFNSIANDIINKANYELEQLKIKDLEKNPLIYDNRTHIKASSNRLNKLNKTRYEQLGLIKIKGQNLYIIYNANDKFYIDNNIYLAYRKKIKSVFEGTKYEIDQYLKNLIK